MKAPDKIHIDDLAVVNDCVTKISLKGLPNFSEYIRKDALLEWVKEHKRVIETHGDERNAHLQGEYSVLNALIDKLNLM